MMNTDSAMGTMFEHAEGAEKFSLINRLEPEVLVQVFDRISLPTFILDKNHNIIHWNAALEVLTGISRSDAIGSKNQWKPFYASPRPCLADILVDDIEEEQIMALYPEGLNRCELIPNAYEGEGFFPECGTNGEWLQFTAAAILNKDGKIIGAIETLTNISARKQAEHELRERERLYKELSITDSLTGLHNSRHFYDQIQVCIDAYRRFGQGFSLAFFDLDNFKQLNDTHGHFVGDRILETFGELLRSCLRSVDGGFRYGGEEFVVLLPSTDLNGASMVADRVRQKLSSHRFTTSKNAQFHCTVSVGVTTYQNGDSLETLIQRADSALYKAKDAGKNRVITAY